MENIIKFISNKMNICIIAIGASLSSFLGGYDGLIFAIAAFATMDYITGVLCALKQKSLSSQIGFSGIYKKICMFLLIGGANIVDRLVFGEANIVRSSTIFFYIANEGISIIENASILGLPVPEKLKESLGQLKNGGVKIG